MERLQLQRAANAWVRAHTRTRAHTHTLWREWERERRRSRINGKTKSFNFIFSKVPQATSRIFPTQRGGVKIHCGECWGWGWGWEGLKGAGCAFALRQKKKKKSFMRRNKAADRRLERKIWPLYLAARKKLTAVAREKWDQKKGGEQAGRPQQQLLSNKRHIRKKKNRKEIKKRTNKRIPQDTRAPSS